MIDSFYDGVTEDTAKKLEKMQLYVKMALEKGDAVHVEKPGQLIITIRLPKKEKKIL